MNDLIRSLMTSPEERGTPAGIWFGLFTLLEGQLGIISRITFMRLAVLLDVSESVLRHQMRTLAQRGWAEMVPSMTRGEYNVYVYSPLTGKTGNVKPTPLFDSLDSKNQEEEASETVRAESCGFRNGNGNGIRNGGDSQEDSNIFININKKINKQRKESVKEDIPERAVETVALADEISGSEWESARKFVVQSIWERGTARDLVDLTTLALCRNWIDAEELKRIVRRADDNLRDYDRTDGRIGKNCRWATIRERIAIVYGENGGVTWENRFDGDGTRILFFAEKDG